jgi:uncharacterized protein YndB with AHSA1/START domain
MDDSIVIEIDIEAPPESVFEAWTNSQQLMAWWGDDAKYRVTSRQDDFRVGGKWRAETKNADGAGHAVWGEYTRMERPLALAFTWKHDWDATGPITHVLIELTPTATGTHLKVTHSGFASEATRDAHRNGWAQVLAWLNRYLNKR